MGSLSVQYSSAWNGLLILLHPWIAWFRGTQPRSLWTPNKKFCNHFHLTMCETGVGFFVVVVLFCRFILFCQVLLMALSAVCYPSLLSTLMYRHLFLPEWWKLLYMFSSFLLHFLSLPHCLTLSLLSHVIFLAYQRPPPAWVVLAHLCFLHLSLGNWPTATTHATGELITSRYQTYCWLTLNMGQTVHNYTGCTTHKEES